MLAGRSQAGLLVAPSLSAPPFEFPLLLLWWLFFIGVDKTRLNEVREWHILGD